MILLPFPEVRQAAGANAYAILDAETLSRAANGPLLDQRIRIDGVVRRVQLGNGDASYAVNGWRARNWVSVDSAPGAAVDGQISVLYDGDASALQVGQPVTLFGRSEGYDPTSTNGFGAKPNPPLVVAEYVARIGDIPAAAPRSTATTPALSERALGQAPRAVLNMRGQGTTTTDSFSVSGDWNVVWSYDCSSFGPRGNFQIFVHNGDSSPSRENSAVNQTGASGSGAEHYRRPGVYYLVVNSECEWQIGVEA